MKIKTSEDARHAIKSIRDGYVPPSYKHQAVCDVLEHIIERLDALESGSKEGFV